MADKKQYGGDYALKHSFNEDLEALKVDIIKMEANIQLTADDDSVTSYKGSNSFKALDNTPFSLEGFSSAMFYSTHAFTLEVQPCPEAPYFNVEVHAGKNDIYGHQAKITCSEPVYVCLKA